jgi:hypothetical protein
MSLINSILNNSNFLNTISSVAAVFSSLCALVAIFFNLSTWKTQLKSNRAYFTIKEPGIKPLGKNSEFRIQITLINDGKNIANELNGKIITLETKNNTSHDLAKLDICNDIPPSSPTPWYNDSLKLSNNMPPQYIVVAIKYNDLRLKKHFNQVFYMKWHGIKNGKTDPNFVQVSTDEKIFILKHIKNKIKKYI